MILYEIIVAGLSKIDRHHRILKVLSTDKTARLPDLEHLIKASRITIQRDLVELEKRGLVRRFHGGAMLTDYDVAPVSHIRRMAVNRDQKRRLAAATAAHITAGSFLGVDASSTLFYLSEADLPDDLIIVTSGVDMFVALNSTRSGRMQTIVTGGRLQPETHTLVGPDALQTIGSYHYEAFLFSAYSVIPGDGVFEYHEDNAAVKRAFAQRSDRRILVLDSTKFEHRGGVKVCDLSDVDLVITDGEPEPDLKSSLGAKLVVI